VQNVLSYIVTGIALLSILKKRKRTHKKTPSKTKQKKNEKKKKQQKTKITKTKEHKQTTEVTAGDEIVL
jgi:hypothetical protein